MLLMRKAIPQSLTWACISVSILAIVINVMEIGLIFKKKRTTRAESVLISLSFADVLVATGLGVLKLNDLGLIPPIDFSYILILTFFLVVTSLLHVILLTVERIVVMISPFWHKAVVTRKKIVITLFMIWALLGLGYSIEMVSIKVYKLDMSKLMLGTMKFVSALFFTMSIFMFVAYALIVLRFRISLTSEQKKGRGQKSRRTKEKRLLLTSCMISGIYIMCHLPYTVAIWYNFIWVFRLHICISLSALMNSLVYFFFFKCMKRSSHQMDMTSKFNTRNLNSN